MPVQTLIASDNSTEQNNQLGSSKCIKKGEYILSKQMKLKS